MGTFDWYEPSAEISCPTCGALVTEWQGYEGPCALVVWRQGEPLPVAQRVDADCRVGLDRFAGSLPATFTIAGWCPEGHPSTCTASVEDDVWSLTNPPTPSGSPIDSAPRGFYSATGLVGVEPVMSGLPPPPPRLAAFTLTGGIRGPLGWGGTWPFGHIEFDHHLVHIWGVGMDLVVKRSEVRFVRIDGYGRTSVVMSDGVERRVRFIGGGRTRMAHELSVRGWPVLNDRRFRRYRP